MLIISHIFCILSLAWAQDQNQDLKQLVDGFFNSNNQTEKNRWVEVTSEKPNGFGYLEKCGEGANEGVNVCVSYHLCDGITNTVVQDGRTTGFGQIDIRFGANRCEHYLDVCCNLPNDTTREPPRPPVSSERPPVIPTGGPVTSLPTSRPTPPPTPPPTARPSSIRCGIRNPNGIDFKISTVTDNEAEYGEFPWMVAILRSNYNPSSDENLAICGGSLIAPNVVLTGAHCISDLNTNEYKVRAGEWDTQTEKERLPYQERTVKTAIIHEEFTPKVIYNNIALLILSSPFDPADNIGTICLPNQSETSDSRNCLASGWGKDIFGKEGRYQVILKKIELPIVPFNTCQKALRTTRLGSGYVLHRNFMCAGGEQGKDTCTGDGGSPLVCPANSSPGRYIQAGIVSWGIGCGEKDIPGVYANVAKFRNWIDNKLSRLNINDDTYTL